MAMSFMGLFLFLFAGSGGDLLDLLPTEDYWKSKGVEVTASAMIAELASPADGSGADALIAKLGDERAAVREEATAKLRAMGAAVLPKLREAANSKDAEVKARAEMLIEKLTGGGPRAAEVRRLMAIRALGELKAKEALPILAKLADSRELFVAEYARAAAAAIEGKPAPKVAEATAEQLRKDLALLPPGCGIVAQVRLRPGTLPSIDDLLASHPEERRAPAREEGIKGLIKAAETSGNVRVLGATLGVSSEVSDDAGFLVLTARGLYDPNAVAAVLRAEKPGKAETVEGQEVFRLDREFALIMPGPDRLVLVGGPSKALDTPLKAVAKAVKAGGKDFDTNDPLAAMVQAADKSKTLWAVAKISDTYRKLEILKGIQTVTLEMDGKAEQAVFSLTARATDANAAEAALQLLQRNLADARKQIKETLASLPTVRPWADFLESVKLSADGTTLQAAATMKEPAKGLPAMMTGILYMVLDLRMGGP